jgi:hypothetical protein
MADPSVTDYATLGANAPTVTSAPTSGVDYSGIDSVGTEYSALNDPSTVPLADAATGGGSLTDIASAIMGTGTAKGAALGALFTELLKNSTSGQGVARPTDFSQYAIPGRETVVAAPRFVPYSEYGVRDVPAMSDEMMRSFGAPSGLGSLMPMSQYSAMPTLASRAPMTFSSVGSGRNLMPTINVTPRSTEPISPLTGALLGGALGYLITPESAASAAGAKAAGNLYDLAKRAGSSAIGDIGGLISGITAPLRKRPLSTTNAEGERVPVTGSQGETYYQQYGNTYAINPDGSTRLVYNPSTGEGSAGGSGSDNLEFGGNDPWWSPTSPYNLDNINNPAGGGSYYSGSTVPSYLTDYTNNSGGSYYSYEAPDPIYNFSGGTGSNSYYNTPDWTSDSYWGDYQGGYKDGGMATPLMAGGGQVQEPSFYTYGTVVDPMQMMGNAQNDGMAKGGMAQGGLHVPTVEGRHDYRAGSRVMGPGDGQSDDIPAMLADGEYVFDADTVAQLGNGSSKAGSDMLDKFREEIRAHKRSAPVNKIPPASKSPLQYLKQAQARSKKNG